MSRNSHKKYSEHESRSTLQHKSFSASKSELLRGSITLKQKLINFLIKTSEIERKLEIIKESLCEQESFTPESVFHRIDSQRKGYILQKDIQNFLRDNKVDFKGSQLKILYGKMNIDQLETGVLVWGFQNFILPNQNPKLRYLAMRRPVYVPLSNERLEDKTQWLVSKLFSQIMKQEAKLKQINGTLISSYDFSPSTVFKLLAGIDGFITGQSLNNFMFNQNCEISIEQVGCIMRLIDKQGEGRICLSDFKFFLATLRLKKEHEIFDELSPIPALKNFVAPLLSSIYDREGTLKQRIINNKLNGRSPEKVISSSIRGLQSKGFSNSKHKY